MGRVLAGRCLPLPPLGWPLAGAPPTVGTCLCPLPRSYCDDNIDLVQTMAILRWVLAHPELGAGGQPAWCSGLRSAHALQPHAATAL